MGAILPALEISQEQRDELERWMRRTNAKGGLVLRARIILLASQGMANARIARQLQCQPHVVGKWRRRFVAAGVAGLADRKRSGRPVQLSQQVRQRVVTSVCRQPPKGLSRWSVRTLARHLGLPSARVQRILTAQALHPHRLRSFTFSLDPRFEDKLLEVVGRGAVCR